jgi:hypothetical protein
VDSACISHTGYIKIAYKILTENAEANVILERRGPMINIKYILK